MNWIDGRLALLDFESTGVNVETDRVVTAAFHMVGGGEKSTVSHWLINPGIDISPDATAVHGITNERARDEGVPAPGAIGEIAFAVRLAIHNGWPVVIYNSPFDLTMLDRECRRHLIEPPPWSELKVIDPYVIGKWVDQYRRGSRSLAAMCAHYGIELGDDAHDAGADALAAGRLAYRMLRRSDLVQGRHPEIIERRALWKSVRDDLDRLQGAQRQWQAEQAEGLRLYFTRRASDRHDDESIAAEFEQRAASVRVGWPLVPFEAEVTA